MKSTTSGNLVLLTLLILLAVMYSFTAGPAQAQNNDHPNLTGNWQINQAKSDDIAMIMRKSLGRDRSSQQLRSGMSGGRNRRRGSRDGNAGMIGNPGASSKDQDKAQQRMEQARLEYNYLEIFHEGGEFNITNGLDISHLIPTDGSEATIWTQHGQAQATANWRNQTLVVELVSEQGAPGRVRQFSLAKDGQALIVTEERMLPGLDRAVKIRFFYDRRL